MPATAPPTAPPRPPSITVVSFKAHVFARCMCVGDYAYPTAVSAVLTEQKRRRRLFRVNPYCSTLNGKDAGTGMTEAVPAPPGAP